jgi:biopolymer transport protein TolQ
MELTWITDAGMMLSDWTNLAAVLPSAPPSGGLSGVPLDGGITIPPSGEGVIPVQAETKTPPAGRKIIETTLGDKKTSADDFSIMAIFLRADVIVKAVICILVIASIWSWAVIFDKWLMLRRVSSRSRRFENSFWSGGSVDDLYEQVGQQPNNPMAAVFASAMREWRRSTMGDEGVTKRIRIGVGDRIDRVMQVSVGREMNRLERYLGSLATIGSTAPFIGLFGTVWGVMRSFQEIAIQKNTNLTTVAPGIAEALFATALGLVAAIPAVMAYNKLSGDLDRYAHRLEGFAGEFSAIVSRELENEA